MSSFRPAPPQEEISERIAIMVIDGGMDPLEASRLARERPWETDPRWGMPKEQLDLEMPPWKQAVREFLDGHGKDR